MDETQVIRTVMERAGAVALAHFTNVSASLKTDRTLVTEADLAVQALLVDALDRHYPCDGIIAEEDDLRKASRSGRYWTVDPIDGTVPFVAGFTNWSIALGLLDGCRPVSGFILVPASGDFFHAVPGKPACRNGRPLTLKAPGPLGEEGMLLTHTRPHQRYTLAAAFPGRVFCLGTASVHLAHVATGGADAVLIGHDRIWDLAPGLAMLQSGGGVLRYLDGTDVSMESLLGGEPAPLPMLGGRRDVIGQVQMHLDYWAPRTIKVYAGG